VDGPSSGGPDRFAREHGAEWATLLALAGRPSGLLTPPEALDLATRYRSAVADLALARRRYPGDAVVDELERIVGLGRSALSSGRPTAWRSLIRLARSDYWRLILERPGTLLASAAMLLMPALLMGLWVAHDPASAARVLPDSVRAGSNAGRGSLGLPINVQAGAATLVTANNIGVAARAFAGGIVLGLGTAYVLATNGMLIGGVAAYADRAGTGQRFIALVAPHGILELSCVVIAGAAGLRMAWVLVDPGPCSRRSALAAESRRAVVQLVGTIPYFVVAGCAEGFITPRGFAAVPAVAIGLALASLLWVPIIVLGTRRGGVPPGPIALLDD